MSRRIPYASRGLTTLYTYVDKQLTAAFSYVDEIIQTTIETLNNYIVATATTTLSSAQSYSDATLSTAQSYTDTVATTTLSTAQSAAQSYSDSLGTTTISTARSYADDVASATLSSAQSYTDTLQATLKDAAFYDVNASDYSLSSPNALLTSQLTRYYTDVRTNARKQEAITESNAYTDVKKSEALNESKEYTDVVATTTLSTAQSVSNTYTDERINGLATGAFRNVTSDISQTNFDIPTSSSVHNYVNTTISQELENVDVGSILEQAQDYTDIAKIDAITESKSYSDVKHYYSKAYTDTLQSSLGNAAYRTVNVNGFSYSIEGETLTSNMSRYYADIRSNARRIEAVNESKAYTDTIAQNTISSANTYTDALQSILKDGAFRDENSNDFSYSTGNKLLTSAMTTYYTDTRSTLKKNEAIASSNGYTDTKILNLRGELYFVRGDLVNVLNGYTRDMNNALSILQQRIAEIESNTSVIQTYTACFWMRDIDEAFAVVPQLILSTLSDGSSTNTNAHFSQFFTASYAAQQLGVSSNLSNNLVDIPTIFVVVYFTSSSISTFAKRNGEGKNLEFLESRSNTTTNVTSFSRVVDSQYFTSVHVWNTSVPLADLDAYAGTHPFNGNTTPFPQNLVL
eukprot:6178754-Pleurochrysis_carterae.AAC.1